MFSGEHRQKSLNWLGAYVARIRHRAIAAMLMDVNPDLIKIGLFSTQALVKILDSLPDLIEQSKRLQRRVAWFRKRLLTGLDPI